MKSVIYSGLEPDYKQEIRGAFKASLPIRKRIQDILEDKVQQHFKAQYNRTDYESANWALRQSDSMGYIRALREVISLLDDKEKEVIQPALKGRPTIDSKTPKPLF